MNEKDLKEYAAAPCPTCKAPVGVRCKQDRYGRSSYCHNARPMARQLRDWAKRDMRLAQLRDCLAVGAGDDGLDEKSFRAGWDAALKTLVQVMGDSSA